MFFVPLPQGPRRLTNEFLPTVNYSTLVTVYNSTLLFLRVLVLWPYQHLFNGPVTSEICLNPILGACVLDAFPQVLNLWDNYVSHTGSSPRGGGWLFVTAGGTGVLRCVTNMVCTIILPVAIYYIVLYFVYDPPRIPAPYQSFPEMLQLLI